MNLLIVVVSWLGLLAAGGGIQSCSAKKLVEEDPEDSEELENLSHKELEQIKKNEDTIEEKIQENNDRQHAIEELKLEIEHQEKQIEAAEELIAKLKEENLKIKEKARRRKNRQCPLRFSVCEFESEELRR